MRLFHIVVLLLLLLLAVVTAADGQSTWRVGVGSRTVLPEVNGRTDYVQPVPPTDATDAGTFVRRFDVGNIAVGNGAAECHWVHDDLRVRAVAIGPDQDGVTVVMVSGELYMFFANDLEAYYDGVHSAVGSDVYTNLRFFVHAQHNHQGPDTSGISAVPVNHRYYAYMVRQMVNATLDALSTQQDAELYYGGEAFYYGLGDHRDPRLQDATVRVLRALPTSGAEPRTPIATLVQWGMHPEVTLNYAPTFEAGDCLRLPIPRPNCTAQGRFFTHDYPGWLSAQLSTLQGGGEVLYFNGAIGVQVGNHGPVWEVDAAHPLGNGRVVPPNAEIVPKNFRRAYLIGTALANFTAGIATEQGPIPYGRLNFKQQDIWVRITNFAFRFALSPASAIGLSASQPIRIGNTLRLGYTCDGVPSNATCVADNYAFAYDSVTKLPFRTAPYQLTETNHFRLGPMQFLAIPGELAPEMGVGLPADFDTAVGTELYFKNPSLHAVQQAYTLPGVVMSMLQCEDIVDCWLIGLCNDEVGYMFPISDWRLQCIGSDQACTEALNAGALNYTDSSVAGITCKFIQENQEHAKEMYVQQFNEDIWTTVNRSCFYGQKPDGYPKDHYEETNAGSWDIAAEFIDALGQMLGVAPSGRYCEGEHCSAIGGPNIAT